jgi:hypothetical protein
MANVTEYSNPNLDVSESSEIFRYNRRPNMFQHSIDTRKKIWNENIQRKCWQEVRTCRLLLPGNVKLKLSNSILLDQLYLVAIYFSLLHHFIPSSTNCKRYCEYWLNVSNWT